MKKIIGCIGFLLMACCALHAQVSVGVQNTFPLSAIAAKDTILIPLKLEGAAWKDVSFSARYPLLVRYNTQTPKSFRDAISVETDSAQPLLYLTVNMQLLNRAGNYEVLIPYTLKGTGNLLTVTLTRPAAQLDTISVLHISVHGSSIESDPLLIREMSNNSGLSALNIAPPYVSGTEQGSLISFSGMPYQLKAGGTLQANYQINTSMLENVKLGKTVSKMQLNSPELAAPINVVVEIDKRKSLWVLVGVIFAGLLAGAFIRHFLTNQKMREESRQKGFQLLQQIKDDTKEVEDIPFQNELRKLSATLLQALNGGSWPGWLSPGGKTSLDAAIDAAATHYEKSLEVFQGHLQRVQTSYLPVEQAVNVSVNGSPLGGYLITARGTLQKVDERLVHGDPTAAERQMNYLFSDLNSGLKHFFEYIKGMDAVGKTLNIYPEDATAELKQKVSGSMTDLSEEASKLKPAPDMNTAVQDVALASQQQESLENAGLLLVQNMEHIYRQKNNAAFGNQAFSKAWQNWTQSVQLLTENPERKLDPTSVWDDNAVKELDNAWQPFKPRELRLAENGKPELINATSAEITHTSLSSPKATNKYARSFRSISIEKGMMDARKNWLLYAVVQTLLVAFLLSLAAIKVYGPSFIGTWPELLTLFLFAFSLDITVDNVLQLRDRKIAVS